MTKKKSIVIILAVVMVAVLVVLGVKFFILDAKNVEIPEQFEGLTWGMKIEDAKFVLEQEGYIFREHKMVVFDIENFGGYEGAMGYGALLKDEYGKLTDIILSFKDDNMDEKSIDEFAEKCIDELDEKFDKKILPETYVEMQKLNQSMNPGLLDYDENMTEAMYFGEISSISIRYYKGESLIIAYLSSDSEYSKEMMVLAK